MTDDRARLDDFLAHILDAIDRIDRYSGDMTLEQFLERELVQDAVVRNLEVIGEASRNITRRFPDFVLEHSEIPFVFAYEMRNALSHGYFQIDLVIVWNTIKGDLPDLRNRVARLVAGSRP